MTQSTAATTVVVLVGPTRDGIFRVHAAGCRDIKREARLAGDLSPWTVTVASKREAVSKVYGPEAGSFYEEAGGDAAYPGGLSQYLDSYIGTEVQFAPCVSLPTTPPEEGS
jgi:hypothetical protein